MTTMEGIKIGAGFAGLLAVVVVTASLVGLIGAGAELGALPLAVCVWPRASETESSNNPVKTKKETRLPQKHLDMIFDGSQRHRGI